MEILPKTRKEAIDLKVVSYFTGIPCQNNHIDKRYSNTGICYQCKRDRNTVQRKRNPELYNKISKKTYYKNREKRIANSQRWAENNRERSNAIKKRWYNRNKETVQRKSRLRGKQQRKNPQIRLSKNLSKNLWHSLKRHGKTKLGKSYKELVNWTTEGIISHLESKFYADMTWDNYGTYWHVDHIKPLSSFSPDNIMDAWELSNLQPLTAKHNYSKGNKMNYENTRLYNTIREDRQKFKRAKSNALAYRMQK